MMAAGFIIYAGQGAYAKEIFRISMMGEIADADIERLTQALRAALR
jgi:2-aminoethylphosphonate-pyruvate transaminase